MTREEAAARIKDHIKIHRYYERNAVKIFEALDMAIKALEQPDLFVERENSMTSEVFKQYLDKVIETVSEDEEPDLFIDAEKLKRCRFEYINACKIVAHPTPDTSKNDIYDAYAVIKALHPIFGDEE